MMADFDDVNNPGGPGLDDGSDWRGEAVTLSEEITPIKLLKPKSSRHQTVLDYLLKRLSASERAMAEFYPRWIANERRLQAFIDLPDWEQQLKDMNDSGAPPKVVNIVVPYIFATHSTILTYLLHAFTSKDPMWQIGAYRPDALKNARQMELVLQYQANHMRLVKQIYQFLSDGLTYGVGILKNRWTEDWRTRTVWTTPEPEGPMDALLAMMPGYRPQKVAAKESRLVYAGNEATSVDPFMFFPDPNVPMHEVNRRGEFVAWRSFEGKHILKGLEADGVFSYVDSIGNPRAGNHGQETSVRNVLSGGKSVADGLVRSSRGGVDYHQLDQMSITIIPAELKLGESTLPEKWLFTIANKTQIVQAEPLDLDHDMHPVSVTEPYSTGYGFGNAGIVDYLTPIQDTLSWYVNSHIENVRATLNNILIVDPSMVEMQDLKKGGPGKLLRLKPSAYGQDVRRAISQLPISDVTSNHFNDFETLMRNGDILSSVTDNLRGIQDMGGRKSATEARQSAQAASSRLAALSRVISAQAMTDLVEQMSLNTQQFLEDDFYFQLAGPEAEPIHIAPEMLVGDFYYPVHDGTLPVDKVALIDTWKEVFMMVASDQELRQQFDVPGIFKHLADLAGAKELKEFKIQVMPQSPEAIDRGAQAGNLMPIGGGMPG